MSDLRRDLLTLAPPVDTESAWREITAGVPLRRKLLVVQRVAAAALLATSVAVVGLALRSGPEPLVATPVPSTSLPVVTTAFPETTVPSFPGPLFPGPPSQSPEDAARDGVVAELAAMPYEIRVNPLLSVDSRVGSWILSRPSDALFEFADAQGCRLGEIGATPPPFCAHEYGELLLVQDGVIVRAYPSPSAPLSWMHIAPEAIYAGRIGDGALPDSTIMRVDMPSFEAEVVRFPHPDSAPNPDTPSWWRTATADELAAYPGLVGFADSMEGLRVDAWVGEVVIDLNGIRALFDADALTSSSDLIRVGDVVRCRLHCFDVTMASALASTPSVYPPDVDYGAPVTERFDCSGDEIVVEPVVGFDPTRDGPESGCEAILAFARWALISPYFHLDRDGDTALFRQLPGPWATPDLSNPGCFGSPVDPPLCDLGHEAHDDGQFITVDSVDYTGDSVRVTGIEWDVSYVDAAFVVRGRVGLRTVELACGAIVEAPSPRGPGWKRILDGCLLAELSGVGEEFPGVFEVVRSEGATWGMAHRPEITLP